MTASSVWKNKEYLKFFASFTTGNIGDWFDVFALQIIFAHNFNATPMMLSWLMFVYLLPMAFFGAYAGIIADKFKKKHVLIVTDILSGLATVLLIASHSIILSLSIVFIRSTIGSINAPAQQSALKYIVTENELLQASSYNQIVFQLCQVVGPLLGALVIALSSAYWCLAINAISFFVSVLFLLFLKPINEKPIQENKEKEVGNFRQTLNIIIKNKELLNIFILAALISIPVMMGFSQLVILLKTLYPGNETILGLLSGIGGCGTIVAGGYLSSKKELTYNYYMRFLILGTMLIGISNLVYAIYPKEFYPLILYFASFIGGAGFGIGVIVYSYLRVKETPHEYMGRVSGFMGMIMSICYILGTLLGGVVTSLMGVRSTFILMAISGFLIMVYIIFSKGKSI